MFVTGKTGGDFSIQRREERKKPVIHRSAACAGERMAATDPRTEAPVRFPACPDALQSPKADRVRCLRGLVRNAFVFCSKWFIGFAGGCRRTPALAEFHVDKTNSNARSLGHHDLLFRRRGNARAPDARTRTADDS